MITELREANASLNDQISVLKGSLVELRASVCDKQLIIETLRSKLPEQEKTEQRISDMQKIIDDLNGNIDELTQKKRELLSSLEATKRQRDFDIIEHQHSLTAAVLDVKVEAQKRMEEVVCSYQRRIDEYVAKIEAKDNYIENLRNKTNKDH